MAVRGLAGFDINDYSMADWKAPDISFMGGTPQIANKLGPTNLSDFDGMMKNFNLGAQGVLGLASAYTGYKNLGLMEDQLEMQRKTLAANDAANVKAHNIGARSRANLGSQLLTGQELGSAGQVASEEQMYNDQSLARTNF